MAPKLRREALNGTDAANRRTPIWKDRGALLKMYKKCKRNKLTLVKIIVIIEKY